MAQNQRLADKAIEVARGMLHIREAHGRNDGPEVEKLLHFVGLTRGQPWCAAAWSWAVYHAGAQLGITPRLAKTGSSTALWNDAHHKGLLIKAPIAGCTGLEKAHGRHGKSHQHTCLVESVHPSHHLVISIDGNWGNKESRTAHPIYKFDFVATA